MGSGTLGRELDLRIFIAELEKHLDSSVNANYTSDGMVTIRLEEGGPAYTIYRTGTFQIRGAKTEEKLSEAESRFQNILCELHIEIPEYEFTHVTSVFMDDFNREINLEALAVVLGMENTEYEPEQFPGLICRPPDMDVTLLVFASGKIIIGGTTDKQKAASGVQLIENKISSLDRL